MSMREHDAAAAEEQLRAVVAGAGLQWVLDQVDEFVLEGKPEFKRVRGAIGDEAEPHVRELTAKRGVPRSEPYTTSERLALLLEALERITLEPLQLETAIADSVAKDDALDDVVWVDELEREPIRSANEAEGRSEAARSARVEMQRALTELLTRTHQ